MPPIVIAAAPLPDQLRSMIETGYRLIGTDDADAARATMLVTTGSGRVDRAMLERLPALRLIAVYGVGYDGVDLDAADRRGVTVTNTPDVLTDDVADMAIALILATVRRVVAGDRFVREGRWPTAVRPLARRVTGARFGILGLGRIGGAIAHRLEAFDARIAYHNRRPVEGSAYPYFDSAVELARESDVLIVATSGGSGSAKLIDAAVLEALGPEGVLINIARGSTVDEPALVSALLDGRIGGAGLDVFADEPNVPPELFALEQVVLQPHQGSATVETRTAMAELVLANLDAFMKGERLLTPVN